MTKLVINADDFGYCVERDRGIIEAWHAGALSGASLMVTGASCVSASQQANDVGMPLSLHLNLTEGKPLTGKSTLTDAQQNMFYKMPALHKSISVKDIEREINAQLMKFKDLVGHWPKHVDGHQHVHILRGVPEILAPLLASAGVKSIRIPDEDVSKLDWICPKKKKRYENRLGDAVRARLIFRQYDIRAPECFIGVGLGGQEMTQEHYDICMGKTFGVVEFMCHPGYVGIDGDEFNRSTDREFELRTLLKLQHSCQITSFDMIY